MSELRSIVLVLFGKWSQADIYLPSSAKKHETLSKIMVLGQVDPSCLKKCQNQKKGFGFDFGLAGFCNMLNFWEIWWTQINTNLYILF